MTPRVLVLGGTGFIGYHAVRLFRACGWDVTVLALPPLPAAGLLPPEVEVVLADLSRQTDAELEELLKGHDAAVFAAGADDRVTPKAPAWPFFHNANVAQATRFFALARRAGVRRGVLLGSYFAHFARAWPELELARHHPYVRSRVEQEAAVLEAAQPDLELVILELPYIFGRMPGRKPLWTPLIRYLAATPVVFYPRGGSNMVAVERVAEAVVGAATVGAPVGTYLVGDENLTWVEFTGRLTRLMGRRKPVVTLPDWSLRPGLGIVRMLHRIQGREGGLDPVEMVRLQTRNAFFDPEPGRRALGFGAGGLDWALEETVAAAREKSG